MKKIILTLSIALMSMAAMSQINENAIGLRFGGGTSFGAEISYQRAMGTINRLEADLGLFSHSGGSGFGLSAIYQWVWNIEGGFNWYAGPGASIGSWAAKDGYTGSHTAGFYLGIGGQVGVEYDFDEIPLQISLDTRPMIGLGNAYNDFNMGIALALRYTF